MDGELPSQVDERKVAEHHAKVEENKKKADEKAVKDVERDEEKKRKAEERAAKEAEFKANHEQKMKEQEAKRQAAEAEKMAKKEEEKAKIHVVRQQENEVFKMLAEAADEGYKSLVSDCYTEMDANVEMVIKGISYGTILEGRGGTGKTYRVLNKCLKQCGVENVAYTDSYTTPTSFYIWLYKNRDKNVVVIDDVAGFMNNDKILAFLKGALWHTNDGKTRIINYMTTKPLQDEDGEYIPSTCEVDCRLVIITNYLDDEKPHVKAVLSRVNRIRVDVPYGELLNILEQVIKKDYKDLSLDERKEALVFLKENTSKTTNELNIRTLLRVMDYQVYAKMKNLGEKWKALSLKLLERDDRMLLVEKLMEDKMFTSEDERFEKFGELTGESRATWYRLRKKIEKLLKERDRGAKPSAAPIPKTV